jgi:hypothetical protein
MIYKSGKKKVSRLIWWLTRATVYKVTPVFLSTLIAFRSSETCRGIWKVMESRSRLPESVMMVS